MTLTATAARKVAPSILSADFARLAEEVASVAAGGADWLHVDVMDGHFVPNLTIGPCVVSALRRVTDLYLDVHLMIERPERYVEDFIRAGASGVTFHLEACADPPALVRRIRALGARAGVAVSPPSSAAPLEALAPHLDLALVMTVNPGFGGQVFMPEMLEKVRRVRAAGGPGLDVEVDGGLAESTVDAAAAAGANVMVAGSAVFRAKDRAAVIRRLRGRP